MAGELYIAVDLGAGSGRVFLAGVDVGELLLEEVRRFTYPPAELDGRLRWDFSKIFENIIQGLRDAAKRAAELGRPIESIGIDGWGVDYGLLDEGGQLIADPVCYRDVRTRSAMTRAFSVVDRDEIFSSTGIQFLPFNTLFQLTCESADLANASKLLLFPDLVNFMLTGRAVSEFTNATTTQMVNASNGNWDRDLLGRFEIPSGILCDIVPAGTRLGKLKPDIGVKLGLPEVEVIAPATHDTGSAVAGAPLDEGWAFISSGTWSLIGLELGGVLINTEVQRLNFTNEGGAYGTTRFLKNVMGLWIFESCRREWSRAGIETDYDTLLSQIEDVNSIDSLIFPDDERFLNPPSMLDAIRAQMFETGQSIGSEPAEWAKMIFDSLAFRYASVLRTIAKVTGRSITSIQILGGGGRNRYLNQMTANVTGLPVQAGMAEATVIGNVLVQAITAGRFGSLAAARKHVRENFVFEDYSPIPSKETERATSRYAAIEARSITGT